MILEIIARLEQSLEALVSASDSLSSCEINMNNYSEDDVSALNSEAASAYRKVEEAKELLRQVLGREM